MLCEELYVDVALYLHLHDIRALIKTKKNFNISFCFF